MIPNSELIQACQEADEQAKSPEVVKLLSKCTELQKLYIGDVKSFCVKCYKIYRDIKKDECDCGCRVPWMYFPTERQLRAITNYFQEEFEKTPYEDDGNIEKYYDIIDEYCYGKYYSSAIKIVEILLLYNATGKWFEYKDGEFKEVE